MKVVTEFASRRFQQISRSGSTLRGDPDDTLNADPSTTPSLIFHSLNINDASYGVDMTSESRYEYAATGTHGRRNTASWFRNRRVRARASGKITPRVNRRLVARVVIILSGFARKSSLFRARSLEEDRPTRVLG